MSYGVALRNGVPFTLGTIAALCVNATSQWSPLALWPDGVNSPGMWIDPSLLTASFNDSTGTTPVATPGSVADSANPVGLALDIRAGAPEVLGPELVTNGVSDFLGSGATVSVASGVLTVTNTVADYGFGYWIGTVVVGKTYTVNATTINGSNAPILRVGTSAQGSQYYERTVAGTYQFKFVATSTTLWISLVSPVPIIGVTTKYSNISVREVPGNHMLQATSAARPLESARVNKFIKTEDATDGVWIDASTGVVTRTLGQIDPLGGTTAAKLVGNHAGSWFAQNIGAVVAGDYSQSVWLRADAPVTLDLLFSYGATDYQSVNLTTAWAEYSMTVARGATAGLFAGLNVGDGNNIYFWHPQINLGSTALDYQRVNTASDYDATGITPFQLYDGTDDGMATADFTAGTLIDGMDCMIALRRDSGAEVLLGISGEPSYTEKYTGACINDMGDITYKNCGTPTVWVDGVQLAGGTTTTRAALFAALTVADWHILEYRNLDLSSWVAIHYGNVFTGLNFNGARGDIMLFESTASTEDKDKARQYLADKYGVTLA